ncbi:MAG: DTW domain-containing protein [Oleispira antarctica]|uniref:tRNA-uridine aminocarboxypropyltransferase n=1 Tax=Oleispira antarctica RB-8 TaxID=698738 RepID=R4YQJ1_OLEAN|nr:DTW domain-containing protein [Oleispira antarctica]MBQ0791401.1 DTW domain-containing protein [Oleispira antarctica]CCK77367.1 DTW domain containing protein [Oleispira antarctica RB-8]
MSKRRLCPHCERPIKTCLCNEIVQMTCGYQLIILQDPKEAKHALSSTPLLEKSILNAKRMVGEIFDPVELLGEDWQATSLLVFPQKNSLNQQQAIEYDFKHLILLDGTWRKVARMIHLNPWLSELPSFSIDNTKASQYLIRKSPREDGLSTIEAAVAVLNQLHGNTSFDPILGAFNKMIEFQIQAMGLETFENNYQERHQKNSLAINHDNIRSNQP